MAAMKINENQHKSELGREYLQLSDEKKRKAGEEKRRMV